MTSKNRVKLKDIAEAAGLTVTSVSRALKGCSNISKETQERVKKLADELGYISNLHAQSLRNVKFNVIGIVYDNFVNPYYSIVTNKINEILRQKGYRAMVFNEYNQENVLGLDAAKEIISFGIAGVITFIVPPKEVVDLFEQHHTPIVLLGRNGNELNIDSVSSNDYHGGKLAGNYLYDLGGNHFGYIGANENISINRERLLGFKTALANKGVVLDESHIVLNNANISTQELVKQIFKNDDKIDSVFCFNDLIAFETVNYLLEIGKKIPEDINIIGFDNLQKDVNYPMRLTTIDADKDKTAEIAVNLLFNNINDDTLEDVTCKIIDVSLIEGKTTAHRLRKK